MEVDGFCAHGVLLADSQLNVAWAAILVPATERLLSFEDYVPLLRFLGLVCLNSGYVRGYVKGEYIIDVLESIFAGTTLQDIALRDRKS